mgnify:CR=1 FL=1
MPIHLNPCRTVGFAACLAMFVFSGALRANDVDLEKIEVREVRTPVYDAESAPKARARYDWLQIMIEYDADGGGDEWIDRVAFEYRVRLRIPGPDIVLARTVTYKDVPEGTQHAVVYVRPRFILRHNDGRSLGRNDVQVLVHAVVNGDSSGYMHYPEDRPSSRWWEDSDHRQVDNELYNRLETPFAPVDWDYYQDIVTEEEGG